MSGPVHIGSTAQWNSLLSGTSVVIADFYADWCGPCKMIAPHFERLAKEHSRPKKVVFAKVNVDDQSEVSQMNAIRAMPTFKIFHNGTCVETVQGANPSALTTAINKAVQLAAGGRSEDLFKSPGRTLGGGQATGDYGWQFGKLLNFIIMAIGLYLVSLFSAHRCVPGSGKLDVQPQQAEEDAANASFRAAFCGEQEE
ncbi:Thioredoxin [Escovopsis weberi]|uniref:Thioredoxin n=1 Tax=Escovopsis weberi TaxID=150374 RepID=A0A0M8N712_ESCWE|nr:Thioredoxin [Escovopsis weberi]